MGTRSFEERNRRTIMKTGGESYTVTIPKHLMKELRWQVRQEVVFERKGKTLVIKDAE